jgi:hypothetical protein
MPVLTRSQYLDELGRRVFEQPPVMDTILQQMLSNFKETSDIEKILKNLRCVFKSDRVTDVFDYYKQRILSIRHRHNHFGTTITKFVLEIDNVEHARDKVTILCKLLDFLVEYKDVLNKEVYIEFKIVVHLKLDEFKHTCMNFTNEHYIHYKALLL